MLYLGKRVYASFIDLLELIYSFQLYFIESDPKSFCTASFTDAFLPSSPHSTSIRLALRRLCYRSCVSSFTTSSKSVILLLPLTCHIPVRPGRKDIRALWCGSYNSHSSTVGGLVPTRLISPPDVKIETTFFQRKFFITTPCNHPQKQHKKKNL